MNTRARLLLALLGLLALCSAATAAPPNIVMIISDDQSWADYGFMRHPQVKTPRLDQFAAQSVLFPRGYVPSSLCCPSLAAMLTGQYPHVNQITSNDPPLPPGAKGKAMAKAPEFHDGRAIMSRHMQEAATLPRLLAPLGYVSLQTGKWWQGHYSTGGFTHGMSAGDESKGGRHGDAGLTIGRKTMQPIYDFVAEAKTAHKPFFLWYAPMLPHDPHDAPDRFYAKYKDVAPNEQTARYWANIEWFDETCGQLLDHLQQQGVADNTIIVYVSDNGWIPGAQVNRFDPRSKQSQYDGGLRSPIMVRWPAQAKPRRSEALATSLDFLPTLLAAAGAPVPAGLPGVNLLDEAATNARHRLFGECFTHNAVDLARPAASLRWRWTIDATGDPAGPVWKLIVPAPQNEPNAVVELFDLRADPTEQKNLAATEPARVATMRAQLDGWWKGE